MTQPAKAKGFMSGRSQAVRIPAEFRFVSKEVYIRRDPKNGDVILSQGPRGLKEILDDKAFAQVDQLPETANWATDL